MERSGNFYKAIRLGYILISILIGCMAYNSLYEFVNFFGNMQVTILEQMGQLDLNDAAAVKAVFDSIDEAVETINVSFVMTKAAK